MTNQSLDEAIIEVMADLRRVLNDGMFLMHEAEATRMVCGPELDYDGFRAVMTQLFDIYGDDETRYDWADIVGIREILDAAQISFDATWRSVKAIYAAVGDQRRDNDWIDEDTLDKLIEGGIDNYCNPNGGGGDTNDDED